MNPFLAQRLNTADIRQGLSDIQSEITKTQEALEKCERTGGTEDEMQLVLILSGLEIKMTNFAQDVRSRFL